MSILDNMKAGIAASRKRREKTCARCGWTGEPETKAKGRFGLELALWIVFFPVGLLYSLWRLTSKRPVCPDCDGDDLLPAHTKAAEHIRARYGISA